MMSLILIILMNKSKKITILIPLELLQRAQKITGEGITKTIRIALEFLAKKEIFRELSSLKGSYKSKLDLKKLREDSRF